MIRFLLMLAVLSFAGSAAAQSDAPPTDSQDAAYDFGPVLNFEEPQSEPFRRAQRLAQDRTKDFDAGRAPALAREAYLNGDTSLLIYCGAGCAYPAATPDDVDRLGYITIPGAFDFISGWWDIELLQAVRAYAEAWNTEMLRLTATAPQN